MHNVSVSTDKFEEFSTLKTSVRQLLVSLLKIFQAEFF